MITIQCENQKALLASCGSRNIPARISMDSCKRWIPCQRKRVPLLPWSSVSLPFLLEGKHTDADGLQRKTTLKPIRGLIHVLCKSRHFMSICQHWLHNKSSCCAEQGFSQFVEWKYEFIATPVSMCMSVSLSGILILYLYRKKRWSRG